MNSKQKFENFLESIKKNDNKVLIESVKKGFQVCFEGMEGVEYIWATFDSYENMWGTIEALQDNLNISSDNIDDGYFDTSHPYYPDVHYIQVAPHPGEKENIESWIKDYGGILIDEEGTLAPDGIARNLKMR